MTSLTTTIGRCSITTPIEKTKNEVVESGLIGFGGGGDICVCTICHIRHNHSDDTTTTTNNTPKTNDDDDDDDDEDDDDTLKTSNNTGSPFVYSPTCHHVFCVPCISRVMLVPGYHQRTKKGSMTSGRVITMTQGECPICRTELSYFDLKKMMMISDDDGDIVGLQSNVFVVEKVSPPVLPQLLLGAKFTTPAKSYVQFPMSTNNHSKSNSGGHNNITSPSRYVTIFLSNTESKFKLPMKQYLNDTKVQITSWQFLDMTHTFQGRMKKVMQESPEVTIEFTIWLTFSDDYQFMTHGVCRLTVTKRCYIEVSGAAYPQIKTKIQSFVHSFGCTEDTRFCRPLVVHPKDHNPRVPYDCRSLWGNTYIQNNKIGLVSYHFERKSSSNSEEEEEAAVAYISFHHPMIGTLTPLDNGQPVPSRVMFRNVVCSPDMRTFRASICWYDDYHTTWNGMKQWDYEIYFDSQWMCIQSGSVRSIALQDGTVQATSVFGKDLIYINAAAYDMFIDTHMAHELQCPSPPWELEMTTIFVLGQILERLKHEQVTDSTIEALTRMTFVGSNRFMTNHAGQTNNTMPSDDDPYPIDNVQYNHF